MKKSEIESKYLMTGMKKQVSDAFDLHKLDLSRLIKKVSELLDATQIKAFNNDGTVIYSKQLKALEVQLRAVEMALQLVNAFPDKTMKIEGLEGIEEKLERAAKRAAEARKV